MTVDSRSTGNRIEVVDLGRGAVMAIMALDHSRTFLTSVPYNPSDLTRTFPALFLTRWISHFCTPLVFLPTRVVGAVGIAVVALHNRVGPWIGDALGGQSWVWALLYERGRELAVAPEVVVVVLSFLSLTKHPLSLSMTLATLGPALLWLGVVRADRPIWRPLVVIGRVPMAFYPVHVPIIHAFASAYSLAFHGSAGWLLTSPFDRGPADVVPDGFGFGLPGVYLCWVLLLLILYPLCAWFAGLKARSRSVWLSYL